MGTLRSRSGSGYWRDGRTRSAWRRGRSPRRCTRRTASRGRCAGSTTSSRPPRTTRQLPSVRRGVRTSGAAPPCARPPPSCKPLSLSCAAAVRDRRVRGAGGTIGEVIDSPAQCAEPGVELAVDRGGFDGRVADGLQGLASVAEVDGGRGYSGHTHERDGGGDDGQDADPRRGARRPRPPVGRVAGRARGSAGGGCNGCNLMSGFMSSSDFRVDDGRYRARIPLRGIRELLGQARALPFFHAAQSTFQSP